MARSPVLNFIQHYLEMVVAMLLGMFGLGFVLGALLGVAGIEVSAWDTEQPELLLLWMAFLMTAPMVAWMRYRGHGARAAGEMAAAMFVPSFAAIGLLQASLVDDIHALMGIEHTAMFVAMFGVMLARRDEYTGQPGGRREAAAPVESSRSHA